MVWRIQANPTSVLQELIYGPFLSLRDARAQGLKRFFTGKPCKQGHIAERFTSSNTCIQCSQERAAKTKRDNRERYSDSDRRYRTENIEDHVFRYKNYYQLNKESHQSYMAKYRAAKWTTIYRILEERGFMDVVKKIVLEMTWKDSCLTANLGN